MMLMDDDDGIVRREVQYGSLCNTRSVASTKQRVRRRTPYPAAHASRRYAGERNGRQRPASDSRNAAISWSLRTSKTSRTTTGWFQVLPSIAGTGAATSV